MVDTTDDRPVGPRDRHHPALSSSSCVLFRASPFFLRSLSLCILVLLFFISSIPSLLANCVFVCCSSFVQSSSLRQEQLHCSRHILECIDSYLWTPRSPHLPPAFSAFLTQPFSTSSSSSISSAVLASYIPSAAASSSSIVPSSFSSLPAAIDTRSSPASPSSLLDSSGASLPLLDFEDSAHHWGVSVNFSTTFCPCCTLPLSESVARGGSSQGVQVLPCGHAFHQACLPEQACVLCFSQQFTSVLSC